MLVTIKCSQYEMQGDLETRQIKSQCPQGTGLQHVQANKMP